MRGMTAKILKMHEDGHSYAEIARALSCSKPNVAQTVKRYREWNRTVAPIPIEMHQWIVRQSDRKRMLPSMFVAQLLTNVISKELKHVDE